MALIIPNATDTTGGNKYAAIDQAEPDALDFEILSMRSSGVLRGLDVTSAGTSTSVNIAAGLIVLGNLKFSMAGSTGFGLPAAPVDNRFDLIVARVTNGIPALVAIQGDNSATNPSYPKSVSVLTGASSPTANVDLSTDVVLAAIYRSGSNTITTSRIVDKRAILATPGFYEYTGTGTPSPDSTWKVGQVILNSPNAPSGTGAGAWLRIDDGTMIELGRNVGPHFPVGAACLWPSTGAVPSGFVEANGQALSTTTYSGLFSVYGYTHGGAGGSFNVPNYNNVFIRGTTSTGQVGVALGSDTVTLNLFTMPTHTHFHNHTHDFTHDHGLAHTHTATTVANGTHFHAIDHNHASYTTAAGGGHAHTAAGNAFMIAALGLQADQMWANLQKGATQPTADDIWYDSQASTNLSTHTHVIDIPTFTGNSDSQGSHSHTVSVTAKTDADRTSSISTTTTANPSFGYTDSQGGGNPFSIIPGSTQARWIIRASLGNDTTKTGGITGPWSASQTVTAQVGTTYTLLSTDIGNLVTMTNGSANTLTIPSGLGAVAGQRIDIAQLGAGVTTVTPAGGVTLGGVAGLRTKGQYAQATLICTAPNNYILTGATQV